MLPQRVDAIVNSVRQLRPIPSNVTRILKDIENPHITIGVVSEYVGLDQALAALVLQVANSVSMGYGRSCSSLKEAVMRIGLNRLKSILLAASSYGPLNQRLSGYRLGAGELWNHSISTAVAAEWLARHFDYPDPEEAYVSGLLHDIGKLLLDQYILADYSQITTFVEKYKLPLWQIEEKLIGIDHAKVGGLIAERWDFPHQLTDAIRFHHYPSLARSNVRLPAIVNLANGLVCSTLETSNAFSGGDIHPETLNIFNLNDKDVEKLRNDFQQVAGVQAA